MSHLFYRASTGDTVTVPDVLVAKYEADPLWEPVQTSASAAVADLKGKALDAALDDAGLPKTGNAEEKRARLAEHITQPDQGDDTEENS